MDQNNHPNSSHETPSSLSNREKIDDEINLIDLIYPIYKRRKFLIMFCFLVVVIVGIVTNRWPKTYEATVVILPESKNEGAGLGSELQAAFLGKFGLSGFGETSASPIPLLLESKELDKIIRDRYNFHLIGAGKDFSVMDSEGKEENNSIAIQANDPVMAADIANTYVLELDRFNRTNTITSAQRLRKYIEKRLEDINRELEQAQEELQKFQEENKAISINKQTEATLEVLSEMEAQRILLEVEKAAKEKFYKGPHIEIEQLKAQMEALQKNIDRLTYSRETKIPVEREEGKVEFYIPLKLIPALNFDESRLLLQVKAKTGVITMLITQLEQAKLDEAKDMPTINVLDWAEPPKKPVKPRLKLNLILSLVVSFFLGIFLIFFLEFIHKMEQDPETAPIWQEMKKGFINPIFFFKKSKQ